MSKILLVEDDYHLGIVLNHQLEMYEYEVSLLRIPRETVKRLQEEHFDLVIMDKLMNGVDGTDICAQIRRSAPVSDTPVLMMSGYDGAREVCIAAGANNFIAKPFEVKDFLSSIEATIRKDENSEV